MKVYIVEASKGSYDDYVSWVDCVFSDKDKAQAYVDMQNEQIREAKSEPSEPETPESDEEFGESPEWNKYYEDWLVWHNANERHELTLKEFDIVE